MYCWPRTLPSSSDSYHYHTANGESQRAQVINLITIEEGATISTINGATAEVVNNPKDGVWVFAKYLTSPEDPELVGTEDMIFAQDIAQVLE